jgi:hypothetical protein
MVSKMIQSSKKYTVGGSILDIIAKVQSQTV